MNLILLPGNSKESKQWIDDIETSFSPSFNQTALHYYDHWWSSEDGEIDLEVELDKLAATVEHYDRYIIFAKSAGIMLALYGIYEGVLAPEVCIFVGSSFPWGYDRGYDIDNWITNFSIPSLFIQNSHDPYLSFEELESFLLDKNVSGFELKELEGTTHDYPDIAQLKTLMEGFVDL